MAQLLKEIQWSESLLPPVADRAWMAELRRRGDNGSEVDQRVAASPWIREACLGVNTGRVSEIPAHLFNVASRVEGLTRDLGVDLLITEEIRKTLDAGFRLRTMAPARAKSKPEPIQTYHVENNIA